MNCPQCKFPVLTPHETDLLEKYNALGDILKERVDSYLNYAQYEQKLRDGR